jgi:hypothetical protein
VAISGLGLSVTWEALQADAWDESTLAQVQRDWEEIGLTEALERGMVGQRVWANQLFESTMRNPQSSGLLSAGAGVGLLGRGRSHLVQQYWRAHMEEDFLLYLQQMQDRIEGARQLRTNAPRKNVVQLLNAQESALNATLSGPLSQYRYALTAAALPNFFRACQTVLRTETQRRMTLIAIALERHRLRTGHFPAGLDGLTPEFLATVPIDPMSGQPFCYRTNLDGGFTLYSVGEDGKDDGGDATSTNKVTTYDLWSGRDAVWPRAVTNSDSHFGVR